MNSPMYVQLLDLACGVLLLTSVLVLWRRDLPAIFGWFALQGVALAGLVAVLAAHEGSVELCFVAAGVLVLRAAALPWLLRRALARSGRHRTDIAPTINVAASLLAAAGLVLLAYVVSQPIIDLHPTPTTRAVPVAIGVVLIGFLVLVTRRRALSQAVGFLLMDNGITATAFLTTSGVGLVVELGVSLDILMATLVLQILTGRMFEAFGDTDLDELQELNDR